MKRWKLLFWCALLLLVIGGSAYTLVGCVSDQKIAEATTEAKIKQAQYEADRDRLSASGDTAGAAAADLKAKQLEHALNDPVDSTELGPISEAIDFLPPGARGAAKLALGALVPSIAAWRFYKRLTGTIAGVEKAKELSPAVAQAFKENKTAIHDAMGPEAVVAVAKIRARKSARKIKKSVPKTT